MLVLDYLLLSIIALSMLLSLFRGFVSEVLSLLFWLLSFWLAARLAPAAATFFSGLTSEPWLQLAFAYVLLLLAFGLFGGLLIWLIRKLMHATGLGPTDRMLGAVFGALRGVVIVLALVLLARFTSLHEEPGWKNARLVPFFERVATQMAASLPDSVRSRMLPKHETDADSAQRKPP